MNEQQCVDCGELVPIGYRKRRPTYRTCFLCDKILCPSCFREGFCREHSTVVPPDIKRKITNATKMNKLIRISLPVFVIAFLLFNFLDLINIPILSRGFEENPSLVLFGFLIGINILVFVLSRIIMQRVYRMINELREQYGYPPRSPISSPQNIPS